MANYLNELKIIVYELRELVKIQTSVANRLKILEEKKPETGQGEIKFFRQHVVMNCNWTNNWGRAGKWNLTVSGAGGCDRVRIMFQSFPLLHYELIAFNGHFHLTDSIKSTLTALSPLQL